jgi:hypothetical protein
VGLTRTSATVGLLAKGSGAATPYVDTTAR